MLLSTALSKMINNCECVIFLNTPHSIFSGDYIQGETTDSPWIYSEIAMTSLIQKRSLAGHRQLAKSIVRADEALQVKYEVELDHLTKLTQTDVMRWKTAASSVTAKGTDALDILYSMQ